MNTRYFLLPSLAVVLFASHLRAGVIEAGTDITEASKAMAAASYAQGGLDMCPVDPKNELAFWSVDDGQLIVLYSKETKKVISLSYFLCDERPKSTRMTFELSVKSFDSETGVMAVKTGKVKN